MLNFDQQEYKGYRIKLEITGNLETCALTFFKVYKLVKYSSRFVKMYMDFEDNIVVVCDETYKDRAIKALSPYGEITEVSPVTVVESSVDAEKSGIDENAYEILQTEFK